jgi:hypothetical protein
LVRANRGQGSGSPIRIVSDIKVTVGSQIDGGGSAAQGAADVAHIAVAACQGVDLVLTANVAHIANAVLRRRQETCGRACSRHRLPRDIGQTARVVPLVIAFIRRPPARLTTRRSAY